EKDVRTECHSVNEDAASPQRQARASRLALAWRRALAGPASRLTQCHSRPDPFPISRLSTKSHAAFFVASLGYLEVRGIDSFREPVVTLGEHRPDFGLAVLFLVEAGQTHRGPQLQRLGLLLPGNG